MKEKNCFYFLCYQTENEIRKQQHTNMIIVLLIH